MSSQKERAKVSDLFAKAERLRDYPGEYFPAKSRARAAYAVWAAAYPADAAKEKAADEAYAAAEKLRKEADFKNSFIGKGLD